MNSRFLKPVAAILLAVGLTTVSVAAPADAAILKNDARRQHRRHRAGASAEHAPRPRLRAGQLSGADSESLLPIA